MACEISELTSLHDRRLVLGIEEVDRLFESCAKLSRVLIGELVHGGAAWAEPRS